jgi:hypothetical protein
VCEGAEISESSSEITEADADDALRAIVTGKYDSILPDFSLPL